MPVNPNNEIVVTGSAQIGHAIRRAREKRGLDQETFADLADVHRTYVSKFENETPRDTMGRLLAKSHAPVRFNAVAPGLVATPWTATWDAQHAAISKMAPLKRSATADDCAEVVLGLLRSKYVTGQVWAVEGGTTLVV